MNPYTPEYPTIPFDPAYKQFLSDFYSISDTPDVHSHYVAQFTDNATLIMASNTAHSSKEIFALRQTMWEKVATRSHTIHQVFPFGENADSVMIHGNVMYTFKNGDVEKSLDWAARAHLVKQDGKVKMHYYQVYFDTGILQAK